MVVNPASRSGDCCLRSPLAVTCAAARTARPLLAVLPAVGTPREDISNSPAAHGDDATV